MRLVLVDPENEAHVKFLWELFHAREPHTRVSSKNNADLTFSAHEEFVKNHPYEAWYLIEIGDRLPPLGSVFISKPARPSVVGDELSVDVMPLYRNRGIATAVLKEIMRLHHRQRYIANIAETNFASMALFQSLGFTPCQRTFELIAPREKE